MKDVIDGQLYDTDADGVESIAIHQPVADRGDFSYLCERLYKTESGQYFIAGEGGAKTKYSKRVGTGEYSGSSEIRPVSEEEAFRWAQSNDIATEIILDEFGHKIEEA
jgi:hypothetical protein